jgi:hypothetical protein
MAARCGQRDPSSSRSAASTAPPRQLSRPPPERPTTLAVAVASMPATPLLTSGAPTGGLAGHARDAHAEAPEAAHERPTTEPQRTCCEPAPGRAPIPQRPAVALHKGEPFGLGSSPNGEPLYILLRVLAPRPRSASSLRVLAPRPRSASSLRSSPPPGKGSGKGSGKDPGEGPGKGPGSAWSGHAARPWTTCVPPVLAAPLRCHGRESRHRLGRALEVRPLTDRPSKTSRI